jgi:hypothetical protein
MNRLYENRAAGLESVVDCQQSAKYTMNILFENRAAGLESVVDCQQSAKYSQPPSRLYGQHAQ